MIIIAIQDKSTLTKFSLHMRVYCLEVICSQTLQVQWFPSQYLMMTLKLFKLSEVFIW